MHRTAQHRNTHGYGYEDGQTPTAAGGGVPSRRRLLVGASAAAGLVGAGLLTGTARAAAPETDAQGRRPAAAAGAAERTAGGGGSPRTRWSGHWPPELARAVTRSMAVAVEQARRGSAPYGALLVDRRSGRITVQEHNTEGGDGDVTAHAEINVLRAAGRRGVRFEDSVLVTSAEPCPMCAGALVWSRVSGIAYGTSIARLIEFGNKQIDLPMTAAVHRSPFPEPALAFGVRTDLTDPLYR